MKKLLTLLFLPIACFGQYSFIQDLGALGGSNEVVTASSASNYTAQTSLAVSRTRYVAVQPSFRSFSGASGNVSFRFQTSLDNTNFTDSSLIILAASGTNSIVTNVTYDIGMSQYFRLSYVTNGASDTITNLRCLGAYKATVAQTPADAIGYDPMPASANLSNWSAVATTAFQRADSDLTNWAAISTTAMQRAHRMLTNIANTNGYTLPVSWTNIVDVPAGFADGVDDTGGGGGVAQTNISYTAVTNAPWQMGAANLTNWASLAPSAKQDALGFTPQTPTETTNTANAMAKNATNVLGTAAYSASSAFQSALGFTPQIASANLTNWSATTLFQTNGLASSNQVVNATNGLYAVVQPLDADLTGWATITPFTSNSLNVSLQLASANLTNWSSIATSSKLDSTAAAITNTLGYIPLTNTAVLVEPLQRIFPPSPQLVTGGTFLLVSNTGYFVYIGKMANTTTFARVQFQVTTAGNATFTNEVALYSTPTAPSAASQTLTFLAGSGNTTSTGSTGVKSNAVSFAASVVAGTHLWAGIRSASLTTQPTCVGLSYDMIGGAILTKANVNNLTNQATITSATIPAFSTATVAPSLRVTLD